ncbi:hypothetical protein [Neorhizobium sp. T25_13]|uniref:hypothetical protein n=1 Tax=Neorhizobium sp. T25_13 TaxID=2093830 RepID=UPI000CF986D5|nr:hypothetical protein [Neorhizobium sp. T25_13]
MPSFALIAEGQTDQIIIERIIEQLYVNNLDEDVDVNFLQPLRDVTDQSRVVHAPHAGWELVLECCRAKAKDALSANDFVVVQIDTDCGDHVNYGLPLTKDGIDRPYDELLHDGAAIIRNAIGAELFEQNSERFLFAISVHSLESWLLLYFFNIDKTKNCFERLNREILRKKGEGISKEIRPYQMLAREIRYRRLNELSEAPNSFGQFLRSVKSLGLQEKV